MILADGWYKIGFARADTFLAHTHLQSEEAGGENSRNFPKPHKQQATADRGQMGSETLFTNPI